MFKMIQGIPAPKIEYIWPLAMPVLKRAVDIAGEEDLENIKKDLLNRDRQLWMVGENSYAVTSIQKYPQKKILFICYLAGEGIKEWIKELDHCMTTFAKATECTAIRWQGRMGWSKILNYDIRYVVMEKRI